MTSDEHSSVFSPGTLGNQADYLFFVATGTGAGKDIGAVPLSGGSGPDQRGQWTLDFPRVDGYGSYASGFGHVFVSPTAEERCPTVSDKTLQDQTFDLNYAAPGSVIPDPTARPGTLLMVYEGVNACVGSSGGRKPGAGPGSNDAYITTGVATSFDFGKTWPTYRATSAFDFVDLPLNNPDQGPNAPTGAFGRSVCMGNDCSVNPPQIFGRYEILSPTPSLSSLMAAGDPIDGILGDGQVSAFLDDVSPQGGYHVYVLTGNMKIARAKLHGGAPLHFMKWNGQAFDSPGIGGANASILPSSGPYQNCEDPTQNQFGASISYVDDTQQYLLTFVCVSPTDPNPAPGGSTTGGSGTGKGSAWFYSTTYDLSDPTSWSAPTEITGSWSPYETKDPQTGQDYGCKSYKGWYPTFMSLGHAVGHLSLDGYAFYLWGCQTGTPTAPARQYSSRAFSITVR